MQKDSGTPLQRLRVDGGMCKSDLLLQIQADLLNIVVERPRDIETTARGAAYAAVQGLCLSRSESLSSSLPSSVVDVWSLDILPNINNVEKTSQHQCSQFFPTLSAVERERRFTFWRKAVQRSLDWLTE
jgi:glycerol kinase